MTERRPRTLGALRASGYRPRSVKDELRANLLRARRDGRAWLRGIVGYDDTVVPQVENAILARHDFILLGLRGQAKTRILRSLPALLDPEVPVLRGAPLNDDPLRPVSAFGRRLVAEAGDDAPVDWLPAEARYAEKLATPDVTVADLLGDLDPIRAASRGTALDDEEAIQYGIVPRTNRGIFAVNELPDLAPRVQVALLNVLEERDVQIRGLPVRLDLDLLVAFSANPEDYTSRGRIISPLRDRIAAQIHTHYPESLEDALRITAQEAWTAREGPRVRISRPLLEAVEEVARAARRSAYVDPASGVSVRLPIALLEAVVSNAERRALLAGAGETRARVVDLFRASPAVSGKLELVYEGEERGPEAVAEHLIGLGVKAVFDRAFPPVHAAPREGAGGARARRPAPPHGPREQAPAAPEDADLRAVLDHFGAGGSVDVSDDLADDDYASRLEAVPGLSRWVRRHLAPDEPADLAVGMEIALEGLHQHAALACERLRGRSAYNDVVKRMFADLEPR